MKNASTWAEYIIIPSELVLFAALIFSFSLFIACIRNFISDKKVEKICTDLEMAFEPPFRNGSSIRKIGNVIFWISLVLSILKIVGMIINGLIDANPNNYHENSSNTDWPYFLGLLIVTMLAKYVRHYYIKSGNNMGSGLQLIFSGLAFSYLTLIMILANKKTPFVFLLFLTIIGAFIGVLVYGRVKSSLGKSDCTDNQNIKESVATQNHTANSKILFIHIGALAVIAIIIAAFFITGGSLLTKDGRDSLMEKAYESGYYEGKHKNDSLDEYLWALRMKDAYEEGFKSGYDCSLSQFVEYADRERNKNLWNLYSDFFYQCYDDEPSTNPYSY